MAKDTLKEVEVAGPSRHGPNVMEPGDGRLPNGGPDLSPASVYKAAEPYQYSDESDWQFAQRKAMWDSAKAHAEETSAGGASFESRRKALKAKLVLDLAELDALEAVEVKPHPVV